MIDKAEVTAVVAAMESAWNAGDGDGFAAPFEPEADFVNVLGEHAVGRAAIAAGHRAILEGIYRDSRNSLVVEGVRQLADDVALAHLGVTLEVPGGPFAGTMKARMTLVLRRGVDGLAIAALQNTIVRPREQMLR